MIRSIVATLLAGLSLSQALTPPSSDPWYTQPSNITKYKPGQAIRSRAISNRLESSGSLAANVSVERAYQFLYRTTDSLGSAVAAATTLFIPFDSDPTKLLSYQTAYDSGSIDCSPSYILQYGTASSANQSSDGPFIAGALKQGWWVVTPDYEGLDAQYTAGLQAGYATLDSLRVALKEAPKLGLSHDAKYAMMGYSGGALASGWAAELQPAYAPELQIQGAAVGGTVPSVIGAIKTINKGASSGLAFSGSSGMAKAYPNLTKWFDDNLVPSKAAKFHKMGNSCLADTVGEGTLQDFYSYFKSGEASMKTSVPASVFKWGGTLGLRGTPKTPLYIYKAVGDEISVISDTDALVKKYCSQGATIEYYRDQYGNHGSEAILGSANALAWIADRLNGTAVAAPGTCVTKNILFSLVNPDTFKYLRDELLAALVLMLGGKL